MSDDGRKCGKRERERENCGATFGDEIVEVESLTLTFCVLWTLWEMET